MKHEDLVSKIAEYLRRSICFDGVLNPESEDFSPKSGAEAMLLIVNSEPCPDCGVVLQKETHGVKCPACGYWDCW